MKAPTVKAAPAVVDARGIPVVFPASPQQTASPRSQRFHTIRLDDAGSEYGGADEVRTCNIRPERHSLLEVYDNYFQESPHTPRRANQLARLFYRTSPHSSSHNNQRSDSFYQDAPTEPLMNSSPKRGSPIRPAPPESPSSVRKRQRFTLLLDSPTTKQQLSATASDAHPSQLALAASVSAGGNKDDSKTKSLALPSSSSNAKKSSTQLRPLPPIYTPPHTKTPISFHPSCPSPTDTIAIAAPSPQREQQATGSTEESRLLLTPPKPSPSQIQPQGQDQSLALPTQNRLPIAPQPAEPPPPPPTAKKEEEMNKKQDTPIIKENVEPPDPQKKAAETTMELGSAEERDIAEINEKVKHLTNYYKIKRKIGEGTFSTVYKATDVRYEQYANEAWEKQLLDGHRLANPNADDRSTGVSNKQVALKRIYGTSSPKRIANEISILKDLRGCTCIAPLITAFRQADELFIVMPFIEHDDFRDIYLDMEVEDIRYYMRSLFTGLSHLHSRGIIHRDIKPHNFLYNKRRRTGVLIDFGLAERIEPSSTTTATTNSTTPTPPTKTTASISTPSSSSFSSTSALSSSKQSSGATATSSHQESRTFMNKHLLSNKENIENALPSPKAIGYLKPDYRRGIVANRAGTKGFRAPEILFRQIQQTCAIDVWSAGVILISLLTGRYPFFLSHDDGDALVEIATIRGMDALINVATKLDRTLQTNISTIPSRPRRLEDMCRHFNGKKLKSWAEKDVENAVVLLNQCLQVDYSTRIKAADALEHPFLANTTTTASTAVEKQSNNEINSKDCGK